MTYQQPRYDPQLHQRRMSGDAPQGMPDRSWAHGPQPQYPHAQEMPPVYGGQPEPQGYYPQQPTYGYAPQQAARPRKRRRVFMWVFLAIQVLFVIWLVAGLASAPASNASNAATTAAKFCANGGWRYLYSSQADCLSQYGATLKDAGNTGTAIGAGIIVVLWCVVDIIMGVTYLIIRLSRRSAHA